MRQFRSVQITFHGNANPRREFAKGDAVMKLTDHELTTELSNKLSVADIAIKYSMAKSQVYARIASLKKNQSPIIGNAGNGYDAVITKTENVVKLTSDFNYADYVPAVRPEYKMRPVDHEVTALVNRGRNVCLVGETNTGKTTLVEQVSARARLPYLRVSLDNSMFLKDLLGKKEMRNATSYFKTGILVELFKRPSVILFDECNSMTSEKSFFFHELFDNGRLFLQATDEVIQKHPDCRLFMACNPCNAKYSGTSKTNVALARRPAIVNVPEFKTSEILPMIDCGKKSVTESLVKYYESATRLIKEQNLRISLGLSSVRNIAEDIKAGDSIQSAVAHNFYNMALLTASEKELETLRQLAVVCFGIDEFEQTGGSNV